MWRVVDLSHRADVLSNLMKFLVCPPGLSSLTNQTIYLKFILEYYLLSFIRQLGSRTTTNRYSQLLQTTNCLETSCYGCNILRSPTPARQCFPKQKFNRKQPTAQFVCQTTLELTGIKFLFDLQALR